MSNNGALMTVQPEQGYDAEKIALVRQMCAPDSSDVELQFFLYQCQRLRLDPLLKQIYFQKRSGKVGIQVGIDGLRLIAERTEKYAGSDEPKFAYRADDKQYPARASVTVYKFVGGEKCAFTGVALWTEYAPYYRDRNSGQEKLGDMWAKMPHNQLAKCAEAQALRKAFPAELSGVYTHDEMEQADTAPPTPVAPAPQQAQKPAMSEKERRAAIWTAYCNKARNLGFTGETTQDYNTLGAMLLNTAPERWTVELYSQCLNLGTDIWRRHIELYNATTTTIKPAEEVAPVAPTKPAEQANEQKTAQVKASIAPDVQEAAAAFKRASIALGMSYNALDLPDRKQWIANLLMCSVSAVKFESMTVRGWELAKKPLETYLAATQGDTDCCNADFIFHELTDALPAKVENLWQLTRADWERLAQALTARLGAPSPVEAKTPNPRGRFFAMCQEAGLWQEGTEKSEQAMREWMLSILSASKNPALHTDTLDSRSELSDEQWRYLCDALDFHSDELLADAAHPEEEPELAGAAA